MEVEENEGRLVWALSQVHDVSDVYVALGEWWRYSRKNGLWNIVLGQNLNVEREYEGAQYGSGKDAIPFISTQSCNQSHACIHLSLTKWDNLWWNIWVEFK